MSDSSNLDSFRDVASAIPSPNNLYTVVWFIVFLYDDQTCDSKDRVGDRVDFELLYNSVKTEVRQLEIGRSYRRDVVRKATPGRRGSGPPIELGSREVADKMQ